MRRGRIFIYLALILILGLWGAFLVWQRFSKPAADATNAPAPTAVVETTNVVVVTQRVGRGSLLDEKVLEVKTFPKELLMQGMFTNVKDAIGRKAKFDLDAGVPLTSGMLVNEGEQLSSTGSDAALNIPPGMVAVSIPIEQLSSVSYAPQPGDHVNVIVSMLFVDMDTESQTILPNSTGTVLAPGPAPAEGGPYPITGQVSGGGGAQGRAEIDPVLGQTLYIVPSEVQRPRMASQTLLQDAIVLQMGNFAPYGTQPVAAQATPEAAQAAPAGEEGEAPATPEPPNVVTLIVTPQDAVTLNYLLYYTTGGSAKLTLALRSAGDTTRFQTEAVTLQFLLDQYRIPVPVKLPYGPEPRINNLTTANTPVATVVP